MLGQRAIFCMEGLLRASPSPAHSTSPRSRQPRFTPKAAGWRVLGLAVLLAGCSFVSTRLQPYLGGPTFPPTDPTQVAILRAEPTQPHYRLGEVFAEPSGQPTVPQYEQALREGGAKMGAEAVVVVYDRMQVVGTLVTGPWWAPSASPIVGRVVVGLAIRYSGP
ncbi:MAG TPA: hypothetical protein VHF87_15710 [Methylomirabilota bacterium]|nr:hypothetical protein [Methylomirabilota bacterium]